MTALARERSLRPLFLTIGLLGLLSCDSTGPATCTVRLDSGCWTFLGLDGEWVTALGDTPWGLYAGTRDHGVFKRGATSPFFSGWRPVGLDHAIVSSILFVPGTTVRLLVGVIPYSDEQTDAAVFASIDLGHTWRPWDGGLAARRGNRGWAYSLATDPTNPNRLFMGYFDQIVRSEDGGRSWQFVRGDESLIGGGRIRALLVSPGGDGRVWGAGQTSLLNAIVWRSADSGNTWEFVDPTPRNENAVFAMVLTVEGRLFSGVGGGVMRSDDGGASWRYALITRRPGIVPGLARVGRILYAASQENVQLAPGGSDTLSLSDLGLYRTSDGGETWDTLAVPPGVGGGVALTADAAGALLIGTRFGTRGGGVWRLEP